MSGHWNGTRRRTRHPAIQGHKRDEGRPAVYSPSYNKASSHSARFTECQRLQATCSAVQCTGMRPLSWQTHLTDDKDNAWGPSGTNFPTLFITGSEREQCTAAPQLHLLAFSLFSHSPPETRQPDLTQHVCEAEIGALESPDNRSCRCRLESSLSPSIFPLSCF